MKLHNTLVTDVLAGNLDYTHHQQNAFVCCGAKSSYRYYTCYLVST